MLFLSRPLSVFLDYNSTLNYNLSRIGSGEKEKGLMVVRRLLSLVFCCLIYSKIDLDTIRQWAVEVPSVVESLLRINYRTEGIKMKDSVNDHDDDARQYRTVQNRFRFRSGQVRDTINKTESRTHRNCTSCGRPIIIKQSREQSRALRCELINAL